VHRWFRRVDQQLANQVELTKSPGVGSHYCWLANC
jgi:hypothetical protein